MSDTHDELSHQPIIGSTPEEWLGSPDSIQSFRATLDRALERLAVEVAAIRAERDGLCLELEGVRTELELARADLAERERFASAVRELGEIVRHLNVPVELLVPPIEPPVVPAAPPPVRATEPEVVTAPVAAAVVEPEARTRRRWLKKTYTVIGGAIVAFIILGVLLISVGPKVAPYRTYFVRSGSMEPTFATGDLIVLGRVDGSDIEKGDIISFERPDEPDTLVTHRVVGVERALSGRQFQTKGDANSSPDAWRVPASGKHWKYEFRISKLGYVFRYLSTPLARLALLAVPVMLLGLLSLVDRQKRRS